MHRKNKLVMFAAGIAAWLFVAAPAQATPTLVSCYGEESAGITANGEVFNPSGFTAAAGFFYPFGTRLLITYHGQQVVVRVNDTGFFAGGWDLSRAACQHIGLWNGAGRDVVDVEVLHA